MNEKLVKWRLFFVWEEDKEERWLEEMASQGWHLIKGGLRFVFERGEPAEIRYRLDYRRRFPQGEGEYFTMYRDAGWEHICDFKQWHYFRSPAAAGAPDIYTDVESPDRAHGSSGLRPVDLRSGSARNANEATAHYWCALNCGCGGLSLTSSVRSGSFTSKVWPNVW